MNHILERCVELRTGLTRFKEAKDSDAKAAALEVRRTELEEGRARLSAAAASATILLTHGHLPASTLPDCRKALESCEKVEELMDDDPMSLTKGRDYRYLRSRVAKVCEELEKANAGSWKTVVERHQMVDEGFLRRVEAFPGQAQTVASIRVLRDEFTAAAATVPPTEGAYQDFQTCHRALQKEVQALDPEAFPLDVLKFLRAAQQASGAPLSLMTDSVRQWLQKNELLGGIRVRFTGEGSQ